MRVLVTGSEGKIGQAQVRALLEVGHDVRGFDRKEREGSGEAADSYEYVSGDLRDLETVRRVVEGVDAVAHLGAIASDRRGHPDEVLSVNVQGTWNVLIACVESGVRRVVFFSSINALGAVGGHRGVEYLPVDDAYPRHPMSPYQLSKHLGEETCRSYSEKHGIVTVCLRPVYVADPDEYEGRVARLDDEREARMRTELWAYVDIRDVCRATLLGLTAENILHDGFILTADDTLAKTATAELVDRHWPEVTWKQDRATYLSGIASPYRCPMDTTHAKEVLGWQPQHSWRDTVLP